MLKYKFVIPILLLNSYLFSSSINLDLKNYLNKDINSTIIKSDKLKVTIQFLISTLIGR